MYSTKTELSSVLYALVKLEIAYSPFDSETSADGNLQDSVLLWAI